VGGLYGGGGGGGGAGNVTAGVGRDGGQGVIIIIYTPTAGSNSTAPVRINGIANVNGLMNVRQ
jgi:hypothetical protein